MAFRIISIVGIYGSERTFITECESLRNWAEALDSASWSKSFNVDRKL